MINLFEELDIHNQLNPKIWENNKLKRDVRNSILKAVKLFISDSDVKFEPLDIQIVGSNASYNYSKTSDLDAHIICDFSFITDNSALLQAYYNSLKGRFRDNYNITIRGLPLELYVEDVNSSTISNGIYSIYEDRWIKFPSKDYIPDTLPDVSYQINELSKDIEKIIMSNDEIEINTMISKLYMLRKNSLASEGEFGIGNLIFKEIRNLGLIDKLKDKLKQIYSNDISLEERLDRIINRNW